MQAGKSTASTGLSCSGGEDGGAAVRAGWSVCANALTSTGPACLPSRLTMCPAFHVCHGPEHTRRQGRRVAVESVTVMASRNNVPTAKARRERRRSRVILAGTFTQNALEVSNTTIMPSPRSGCKAEGVENFVRNPAVRSYRSLALFEKETLPAPDTVRLLRSREQAKKMHPRL